MIKVRGWEIERERRFQERFERTRKKLEELPSLTLPTETEIDKLSYEDEVAYGLLLQEHGTALTFAKYYLDVITNNLKPISFLGLNILPPYYNLGHGGKINLSRIEELAEQRKAKYKRIQSHPHEYSAQYFKDLAWLAQQPLGCAA